MISKLRDLLEEIRPDIDFDSEKNLISDHVLESFDVLSIGTEIEDVFNVKIRPRDYIPENFNSIEAMLALIEKLKDK